jgi:hypothetical protein
MKITGTRTEIERVDVEIDPMKALESLDDLIRQKLSIPWGSYLKTDKNNKYLLVEDYRGGDSVISENPSQETIDYLLTYNQFYKTLQRCVYA